MTEHERLALVRNIAARLPLAGPDELRVVDAILTRLELGRERYGSLAVDKPLDWRKERREELLDAMVYDVAQELRNQDRERAELRDAARAEMRGGGQ